MTAPRLGQEEEAVVAAVGLLTWAPRVGHQQMDTVAGAGVGVVVRLPETAGTDVKASSSFGITPNSKRACVETRKPKG